MEEQAAHNSSDECSNHSGLILINEGLDLSCILKLFMMIELLICKDGIN